MSGPIILFGTALIAVIALLTIMLIREARRPPRRTAAYAVARGWACDPGDEGLSYESWILDRPDGARLPVWDIDLGGNGVTLVFVHGWGQSRIDMLRRLTSWRAHCGRAVMYDLRGHGESEGSLSHLGHREDEDLVDLITRLDDDNVVIVGHSMGAVIALHTAARDAASVKGVAAFGPYVEFHRSLRGRLRAAGFPTWPVSHLAMAWFRFWGIRHDDLHSRLSEIDCSVLVFHGAEDDVSPLDHGRAIAEGVRDGKLVVVDGAGHTNLLAVAPDGLETAIATWISDRESAAV